MEFVKKDFENRKDKATCDTVAVVVSRVLSQSSGQNGLPPPDSAIAAAFTCVLELSDPVLYGKAVGASIGNWELHTKLLKMIIGHVEAKPGDINWEEWFVQTLISRQQFSASAYYSL